MKRLFFAAVLCFSVSCLMRAPEPANAGTNNGPVEVDARFITISLFKNGLGFVYSEAELPGGAEKVLLSPAPAPVHGTFWLYPASEGVSVKEARAFKKQSTVSESTPAGSMSELLGLNLDKRVVLQAAGKTVIGKIVSVSSGLVFLNTDPGMVALHTGQIQQIDVLEGELKTHSETVRASKENVIEISVESSPEGGKLGIQYLARGITWAPSCSVDITDAEKARMLVNAEIINEIGELEDVTINFVSGFPNFQFSEVVSPVALQGNLASFLNSLTRPGRPMYAPVMRQIAGVADSYLRAENVPGYSIDPEGAALEDLFFYEKKGVSLGNGERGYYLLYQMEVPYEHIYKWDVPDVIDAQDRYTGGARDEEEEEVWHILRLTNTGKVPWTTSPALITQSGQVLGQDTIRYTSPGAETNLRITRAMAVKAGQEEFETSRERAAARFYGVSYDKVKVRGVMKAVNYKEQEIVLSITKMLSGEVTSADHDPEVEMIARGLRRVNPKNRLSWKIPVAPGEEIEVEYMYEVYVRS